MAWWDGGVDFTSPDGPERYAAFVAAADSAVIGLDMDGTLSPIVDDPSLAEVHPEVPATLIALASVVRRIAVITGRPARQALALGGLDRVGEAIADQGRELVVLGQYGNERWTSTVRRVISPRPPAGLSHFLAELPGALREAGAAEAFVERKGLAVAVHTRRLPDPSGALARVAPLLTELAERHGLAVEPGRLVIEVRDAGMDKGVAVRRLAEEVDAGAFLFAGDDLGDLEAFAAVGELRAAGLATLLVCSASTEESALRAQADVIVRGPEGVVALLRRLTADALSERRR